MPAELTTRSLIAALALAAACTPQPPKPTLTRDELMDPESCRACHADKYDEWSASMHAYAADDPLFLAMNRRGQRETNGKLGDFCIKCHAPMAVREHATTDGLNLDKVPKKLKGVTCFFCHSVDEVNGTHDNPLHLAGDLVLRGGIADPFPNTAHASAYSTLHDRDHLESASMCGSCHDIDTPAGAHLERSFAEWKGSVFSHPEVGLTCGQCHMPQSATPEPIASLAGAPKRFAHAHDFAAVDVATTDFPGITNQQLLIQSSLDSSLQEAVCVQSNEPAHPRILVILDNVAVGHSWPSGAAQDRRAWVEVNAEKDGANIYSSGHVPDGTHVTDLADPDLWLLRDCIFSTPTPDASHEVHNFWEAASVESNLLPVLTTFNATDPAFYKTHIAKTYPGTTTLTAMPDEVDVKVHLQAVGLDVIDDLISTGDLDASARAKLVEYLVGGDEHGEMIWTPQTATLRRVEQTTGDVYSCVSNGLNVSADLTPASSNKDCAPGG